jgi:hypothetical protein
VKLRPAAFQTGHVLPAELLGQRPLVHQGLPGRIGDVIPTSAAQVIDQAHIHEDQLVGLRTSRMSPFSPFPGFQ